MSRAADSIAALASGRGAAGVAVIRCSGPNLAAVISPLFSSLTGKPWIWKPRFASLGRVLDPKDQSVIDEAIILFFPGPHSFTGEDVVEIQCHGGPYVVARITGALYTLGIRQADPGEFTKRAFLNGRMDLTAAEGIKELVEAQSHQQWLAAKQLAGGKLARTIESLRDELIQCMALLEAQIDFPDEGDTAHLALSQVQTAALRVRARISELRATYDSGRVAAKGLSVALIGEPNAGKSTLLNTLLGVERAIVTPIAGTTRDYIEEGCLLEGRYIRLLDTAGIRDNPEEVEKIGVATARRLAKEADIVLFLCAGDASPQAILQLKHQIAPQNYLLIKTKVDLHGDDWGTEWLAVSSHSGEGLDTLRQTLANLVDQHVGKLKEETFITSARHRDALDASLAALERYFAAAERGEYEECLAFEVREARDGLQAIVGEVGTEDVLDKIFSSFCIGK